MKKRYLYSLLYGVPGFLVSLIISFVIFGAVSGFLWVYVFGDNPWPDATEKILPALFVLIFMVLWIAFIAVGFITGKNLEGDTGLNKNHVMVSAGSTIAPVFIILVHQWSVGNIGQKSESQLCGEYCRDRGYSTSGLPPEDSGERSCSCFDSNGQAIINIPLDSIVADIQE
jgi:hypothetical protein